MAITCIISFIVGAMMIMCAIGLVSCQKDKKPRNKVHFYVTKESVGIHLWLGKPRYKNRIWLENPTNCYFLGGADSFYYTFNLHPTDFYNMKEGEIREVFLNLED